MSVTIHPMAIVSSDARLGENVEIGPFTIVGPNVEIGDNTRILSHNVFEGHVRVGKNNIFHQYCSIGAPPQDLTYKGEPTEVIIGDNNTFREYVSVHRGTMKEDKKTKIGSNSLFMAYVHFGHDVKIGDNLVIANSVNLAGHVHLGDRVIVGGASSISQFVSVGRGGYIGGASALDRDIPPFCTAYGNRIRLKGINIIGLRRMGNEKESISEVVDFYRTMESSAFSPRAFIDHEELMEEFSSNVLIQEICDFIRQSEIGVAPFMA